VKAKDVEVPAVKRIHKLFQVGWYFAPVLTTHDVIVVIKDEQWHSTERC